MSDFTRILEDLKRGDPLAASELLPLVYDEMRRLASHFMSRETPGHTLQPTALVHEAYVRLLGGGEELSWDNRGHFFAAASIAMRRILVESARRKGAIKHGGDLDRRELHETAAAADSLDPDRLLDLDQALSELAVESPELAKLVELRFFAGLTNEQAALATGVSLRTVKRNWTYARAWLRRRLEGED